MPTRIVLLLVRPLGEVPLAPSPLPSHLPAHECTCSLLSGNSRISCALLPLPLARVVLFPPSGTIICPLAFLTSGCDRARPPSRLHSASALAKRSSLSPAPRCCSVSCPRSPDTHRTPLRPRFSVQFASILPCRAAAALGCVSVGNVHVGVLAHRHPCCCFSAAYCYCVQVP